MIVVVCFGCGADLLNNQAIHTHVDELLRDDPSDARAADRAALNAGMAVPIYGTYALDHRVFGSVRPSAIVFDWILGGLVPAALAGASFAVHDAGTRRLMRWTALGLYGATRVGIAIIGNLHINEYDRYLEQRTSSSPAPRGLAMTMTW